MNDHEMQLHYNATIITRMLIVINGLKLNHGPHLLLVMAFGMGDLPIDDAPIDEQDWNIYEYNSDVECPIHCVGISRWLVESAWAAANFNDWGNFDPAVWLTGLMDTVAKAKQSGMLSGIEEWAIIEPFCQKLVDAAAMPSAQENLIEIRKALARKQQFLNSNANKAECEVRH